MQFFMHHLIDFFNHIVSAAPIFWSGVKDTATNITSTTYNSNISFSAACNDVYDQVALLDSLANKTISAVRADLCNRAAMFFDNIDTSAFVPNNVTFLTNSLFAIPTITFSPGDILLTILDTIGDFLNKLSIQDPMESEVSCHPQTPCCPGFSLHRLVVSLSLGNSVD